MSFGPLRDSKTGRSLFDKLVWKQALSVLKTVQLGHASDPPGIQLYFKTGSKDRYGLTLYRCIRGTNSLEGGVHQNLIRKFGSFGAGPELANAMLTEYRLRHNMDVGAINRLGKKHESHYDPWLVQHIDLLRKKVGIENSYQRIKHLAIEINTLNYRGSKEVYGICPMPIIEMEKIGIAKSDTERTLVEYDPTIPLLKNTFYLKIDSTLRTKNARYIYVAKMQRSKFAAIAVHTLEEFFFLIDY